eukprot:CAMPEP_0177517158 /NCGR_PEP_ID=MMETSP0369-20130122/45818_1 /TAXON_ID=447022 ORGANISM="Scrippsiella hangoei-like, Strain SHHI-4" /NCGR_SAMPLE_ID=MMETSP0369 /ASSEMBLY_ACC=CAM_ASM_000364 /LENGTH=229 /DNA_ID=CAMNT_0018996131 /DNA_START=105 /DNA_END=795 /DNA_ORIENTATION=+
MGVESQTALASFHPTATADFPAHSPGAWTTGTTSSVASVISTAPGSTAKTTPAASISFSSQQSSGTPETLDTMSDQLSLSNCMSVWMPTSLVTSPIQKCWVPTALSTKPSPSSSTAELAERTAKSTSPTANSSTCTGSELHHEAPERHLAQASRPDEQQAADLLPPLRTFSQGPSAPRSGVTSELSQPRPCGREFQMHLPSPPQKSRAANRLHQSPPSRRSPQPRPHAG